MLFSFNTDSFSVRKIMRIYVMNTSFCPMGAFVLPILELLKLAQARFYIDWFGLPRLGAIWISIFDHRLVMPDTFWTNSSGMDLRNRRSYHYMRALRYFFPTWSKALNYLSHVSVQKAAYFEQSRNWGYISGCTSYFSI